MSREIVINATRHESRIAGLDEGQVVELWVERTRHRTIVGNIYKGRVTKVLPGMQSAFVDLGLERDAFLYVSDVIEDLEEYESETPDELHLEDVAQQHRSEASISDAKDRRSSCRCRRTPSPAKARASPATSRCPDVFSSTCRP